MKKYLGFTLAELLIAMAVMGTIAALCIPVLTRNSSPDNNAMMMKKAFRTCSESIEELINSPSYPGYDGVCPSDGEMDTYGLGCMTGSGANSNTLKLPCNFTQILNTSRRYNLETDSDGNVSCSYGATSLNTTLSAAQIEAGLDGVVSIIANGTSASNHYRITSVDKIQWYFPVANGFARVHPATFGCVACSYQTSTADIVNCGFPNIDGSGYSFSGMCWQQTNAAVDANGARNSSIIVVIDVNGNKAPNCIATQIGSAVGCNNRTIDRMRLTLWADGQIDVIDDVIRAKLEASHITKEQE